MKKLKQMRFSRVPEALNEYHFCTNTPVIRSNVEYPVSEKLISSQFIFFGVTIGVGFILYTYLIVTWRGIVRGKSSEHDREILVTCINFRLTGNSKNML